MIDVGELVMILDLNREGLSVSAIVHEDPEAGRSFSYRIVFGLH